MSLPVRKVADFIGCAIALGPDLPARADLLWRQTRNLRVRLGLGRHRPREVYAVRTRFGRLHFRDNFGDITNLTNLLYRGVYRPAHPVGEGVVLDVGANIGLAAVWFHHHYPRNPIHCFEPLAENVALIERNCPSARIWPVAVGAAPGTVTIAVDRDAVMASSIPWERAAERRDLKVVTLDDHIRTEHIPRVALLKLDAEGMELEVLDGARDTLAITDRIAMETHGTTRHAEVLRRLAAAGFTVEQAVFSGETGLVFAGRTGTAASAGPG